MNAMFKKMKYAALVGLTVLAPLSAGAAQFFGAIYDTNSTGTDVNQNIWLSKPLVYMNGGPQNENSQGLPSGTYYFQITDPSGATLLSTDDAVCRQVEVGGNGRISGPSLAAGACAHAPGTLNTANGAQGVQLIPFNDTPNNGGEYKLWLIRQCTDTTVDPNDAKKINFNSNCAKTDNFKVLPTTPPEFCPDGVSLPPCPVTARFMNIGGLKYYDTNTDGYLGETENTRIGGVVVRVYINNGTTPDEIFVTDTDGVWGPKALCVENCAANNLTQVSTYRVCEVQINDPAWHQAGPAPGDTTDTAIASTGMCWDGFASAQFQEDLFLDFGNLCVGTQNQGGLTLGYWSNKNGQARTTPSMLATLVTMNLKNSQGVKGYISGNDFDPTSSTLSKWLTSANATNMAGMLSAQMAAMELNILSGGVNAGSMMYVPALIGNSLCPANAGGFISVGAVVACANTDLGTAGHNITLDGSPYREYQTILKNALDDGNNNRNWAVTNPSLCPTPGVTLSTTN